MRNLRRAGKIGEFVSVYVNEKQVNTLVGANLFFFLLFTTVSWFLAQFLLGSTVTKCYVFIPKIGFLFKHKFMSLKHKFSVCLLLHFG